MISITCLTQRKPVETCLIASSSLYQQQFIICDDDNDTFVHLFLSAQKARIGMNQHLKGYQIISLA